MEEGGQGGVWGAFSLVVGREVVGGGGLGVIDLYFLVGMTVSVDLIVGFSGLGEPLLESELVLSELMGVIRNRRVSIFV